MAKSFSWKDYMRSFMTDLSEGFQAGSAVADTVLRAVRQSELLKMQKRDQALQEAQFQMQNPGFYLGPQEAQKTGEKVDGQDVFEARATPFKANDQSVQKLADGAYYSPELKKDIDKELMRNKIEEQLAVADALRPSRMKDIEAEMKMKRKYDSQITPAGLELVFDEQGRRVARDVPMAGSSDSIRKLNEDAQAKLREIEQDKTLRAEEREFKKMEAMKELDKLNQIEVEGVKQKGRETLADRTAQQKTEKPLTEAQGAYRVYGKRADDAVKVLDKLESQPLPPYSRLGSFMESWRPNEFNSEDRQQYRQAEDNFISAVLRKESGATISEEERESAKRQYIPQPGDKASVVKQKQENRRRVRDEFLSLGKVDEVEPLQSKEGFKTKSGNVLTPVK
jgi:hypothetical protein